MTIVTERQNDSVAPPARSLEQRMNALARANDVRFKRAAHKRAQALLTPAASAAATITLLEPVPLAFESMTVIDFVCSIRRMGDVKARQILGRCQITPLRPLHQLSPRQRAELAWHLSKHGRYSHRPKFTSAVEVTPS